MVWSLLEGPHPLDIHGDELVASSVEVESELAGVEVSAGFAFVRQPGSALFDRPRCLGPCHDHHAVVGADDIAGVDDLFAEPDGDVDRTRGVLHCSLAGDLLGPDRDAHVAELGGVANAGVDDQAAVRRRVAFPPPTRTGVRSPSPQGEMPSNHGGEQLSSVFRLGVS